MISWKLLGDFPLVWSVMNRVVLGLKRNAPQQ
jgi:hypothetical protein